MGQIVYCSRCQTRLTEADFKKGLAFETEQGFVCTQCCPEMPAPPPPAETTRRKLKASTARLQPTPPSEIDREPASPKRKILLFAGVGAGMVILVVVMAVLLAGKPARETAVAEKAPPVVKEAPRPAPEPAARSEAQLSWAVQVRKHVAAREFKAALDALEGARKTSPPGEVDRMEAEVLSELRKGFSEALSAGREAKEKGDEDGFRSARAGLEKWGLESYVKDFDKELTAKTETPGEPVKTDAPAAAKAPKTRSEEGKAYLAKWQAALPKAIARQYPAAVAELEKEKKGLKEGDSKSEQAQDVKDLKLVEELHKEALQAAAKLTAGRKVKLGVLGATGDVSTVEGEVVSADAERIEVRKGKEGGTSYVEPGELTAATLVELVNAKPGKRPATHGRAAALLCLLSGDLEGAKKHLGAAIETLPEKYLEASKDALQKLFPADPSSVRAEREAKQLFWSADREWASMETLAGAVEKYRMLLRDHVGKSIVIRNIALVTRRSEAGREYPGFAADLRGTGTFRLAKHEKLESAWVSAADSEGEALLRNWVEIPFCVLPGVEYRCWALVGGCCKDTFTFYYQATDLTIPAEKRGEVHRPEPDSMVVAPVKHQIGSLKKDHAACKKEKEPARWEWVSLPLPKFTAPGAKRVRILTDQKGFGVACAWVSSTRKVPPPDAELAEERKPEADRPGRGAAKDAGLVLHYSFEAGSGSSAEDLSGQGNAGALKGGPKWGKLAGAPGEGTSVQLDAKDDSIVAPNSGSLDPGTGSFTLSAWVAVGGAEAYRLANKWDGKKGWLVDVNAVKNGDKQAGKVRVKLNDGKSDFDLGYDAGIDTKSKWTHVAVVFDRGANEARVYVNGAPKGQGSTAAVTGPLTNASPLAIGTLSTSKPDRFFKGHVDEVKLFSRALNAAEIQALAQR